jgi:hypothetical protein
MVTVAIRAVELEYLVKVLDSGCSGSQYIFTDSDSTALRDCASDYVASPALFIRSSSSRAVPYVDRSH